VRRQQEVRDRHEAAAPEEAEVRPSLELTIS
jgi:hypothetical protein